MHREGRKSYTRLIVRVLFGCLFFLVFAGTTPQDSVDLRARYGEPDGERFTIRPGITTTAEYGPDGKVCLLDVEPRHAFIHAMFMQNQPTIPKETALDILNELAPPKTRGEGPISGGSFQAGCVSVGSDSYENMQIILVQSACTEWGGVLKAEVRFKRTGCENASSFGAQRESR